MDLKLTRKRALICGGSSGLGRAVATALVAEGAHVALLSRDAARLQAVADELNAMGPGKAAVVTADLADHEGGRRRRACRGWSPRSGVIISNPWCCRSSA